MDDLEIAFTLEEKILKAGGLVLHDGCGCRVRVITRYPKKGWYWVCLDCKHYTPLSKLQPNLNSSTSVVARGFYDWVTGSGERVSERQLEEAYDSSVLNGALDTESDPFAPCIETVDDCSITRIGGVYFTEGDSLRYAEPRR